MSDSTKASPFNPATGYTQAGQHCLNEEIDSLKLVNQSTFATVEEQANSISENKKEILLQNRTIQLLEEYVHSTIPSLASTVDDDL